MDVVVRKVSLDLLRSVVKKTPVDTGRARGNWQLGINVIPRGETFGASGAAGAPLALASEKSGDIKAGDSVFIVNSVPYIFMLEKGSSKQAPMGMVEATLLEYPGIVRKNVGGARRGEA